MRIVFMGTPKFAVPILEALNKKYEVVGVVSQPTRAKKRGVLIETPVAEYTKNNKLLLFQPEKVSTIIEELKSLNAEVLVTAAYGQYLPTKLLNLFKYKINVHGSLLPKHRGGAPIQRAILNGDRKTGITIMEMSKRLDAGKIYSMREYEILPDDNSTSVFEKLSIIGKELLLETIEDIYSGKNQGIPQDETLASYSPNLLPEEEKIDIHSKTKDIINRIHAFAMDIGSYLEIGSVKLKIYEAHEVKSNDEPCGMVLSTKKEIVIKTLDSAISLDLVQLPGKKIMSGRDFSNGQKLLINGQIIG